LDAGRNTKKIAQLHELIEGHPVELARDFREKFGVSYLEIGLSVSYLEAWNLVQSLLRDTTSWVQAILAGWDRPTSNEWAILADIYDLQHSSKSKRRPKRYPRPWPEQKKKIGGKNSTRRSSEDVRAILRPKQDA
jgi:hypothetical protein